MSAVYFLWGICAGKQANYVNTSSRMYYKDAVPKSIARCGGHGVHSQNSLVR